MCELTMMRLTTNYGPSKRDRLGMIAKLIHRKDAAISYVEKSDLVDEWVLLNEQKNTLLKLYDEIDEEE